MRNLIFLVLIVSCTNKPKSNLIDFTSGSKIDTLKMKSYSIKSIPEIFEKAFFEGTHVEKDSISLSFYAVNIGKIKIETGKIINCDPIVLHDASPFIQSFPIGQFPVQLSIAKFGKNERTAYARIYFSDAPVDKWEFALHKGQEPISIFGETVYTYSVDAHVAMFIDEKASNAFNSLTKKDNSLWEKAFNEDEEKNSQKSWFYNLFSFDTHNFASFSTGLGDGRYSTYVGIDKKGNICRLLTDFALVNWWQK